MGAPESAAGGPGLGLAICKGLVEAHGGRIRAESAGEGRGLRVTFTLPVAEEPAPVYSPGAPSPDGREKIPVLVVDDDPNALRSLRDALAAAGYAPAATGDPDEIPGLVEARKPRLALLDPALPGADGIELMRTPPARAGSRIAPSSQAIRLRNTPTNTRGDPTRQSAKQHRHWKPARPTTS